MEIIGALPETPPAQGTVLTIGVFDGLHLGHQQLVRQVLGDARARGQVAAMLTFEPHPRAVLSGRDDFTYLTDIPEKAALARSLGIDTLVVMPFTREFSQLSATEFMQLLEQHLNLRELVVGENFHLGHGREGNIDFLRAYGQARHVSIVVVPPLEFQGAIVSSTRIRSALAAGQVEEVTSMLGHYASLRGTVVHGHGIGHGIGFPTANLEVNPHKLLPPDGIYAVWVEYQGRLWEGACSIGIRPTFQKEGQPPVRTIEVYVMGEHGGNAEAKDLDLYYKELEIWFVAYLRPEAKFDTVDALAQQIERDVRMTHETLAVHPIPAEMR